MKKLVYILLLTPIILMAQNSLERLEQSPRHHEWVTIDYGDRALKGFLVYPEVSENVTLVIVIHENRGLNDWARSMADQIAEAGYIALAPDLLSGVGPNGEGTAAFKNSDDARTAIYALNPEQVTDDLNATLAYLKNISSGNGNVVVIGFCWGGSQSFRFATNNKDIKAAFVCYGTGPKNPEAYKNIEAPIYGFYGGNDNRVNATIENTKKIMAANNKIYIPVIYEGAGHGFFRSGEADDASEANKKGKEKAMIRLKKLLSEL